MHRQALARPRARAERQDACGAGREPPHGAAGQICRARAVRGRRLGRRGRRTCVDEGRTEVPRRCVLRAVIARVHERRGGVRGKRLGGLAGIIAAGGGNRRRRRCLWEMSVNAGPDDATERVVDDRQVGSGLGYG